MYKYLIIISILLMSSCCDDSYESEMHLLSESEKECINYALNDILTYTYSNGFEFEMEVVYHGIDIEREYYEHGGCDVSYKSFERLLIRLASNNPEMRFDLRIVPQIMASAITFSINSNAFTLERNSAPDIDTITLDGHLFTDVYRMISLSGDSLHINSKELLYTKEDGIIQITMTDNEKYTLKK